MNLPWWGWIIGGVVALAAITRAAIKKNRARIETEFVYYLQEHHPSLRFVRQEGKTMVLAHERVGEIRFYMHKLYVAVLRTPPNDRDARRALYEHFARAFLDQAEPGQIDPAKLRPRIVREDKLPELPSRPLDGLGLRVVYVLDAPASVRYVTGELAAQLGLDEPALYARALANLAVPAELVRAPLERKTMSVVKLLDGHDAARLLGVPSHLREGESLLAVIPDVNTLALVAGGEPASLAKLAHSADGEPLFDGVLRVTRDGFSRA